MKPIWGGEGLPQTGVIPEVEAANPCVEAANPCVEAANPGANPHHHKVLVISSNGKR